MKEASGKTQRIRRICNPTADSSFRAMRKLFGILCRAYGTRAFGSDAAEDCFARNEGTYQDAVVIQLTICRRNCV